MLSRRDYNTPTKGFFKLSLQGAYTPLAPSSTNGSISPLVQADNGRFYGITHDSGPYGSGSFFRLTPEGVATVLCRWG